MMFENAKLGKKIDLSKKHPPQSSPYTVAHHLSPAHNIDLKVDDFHSVAVANLWI